MNNRIDMKAVMKLWRSHGGDQHGPRVETVTMPMSRFPGFLKSFAAMNATAASAAVSTGVRYRHKKRGTTYEVVGEAQVQCEATTGDGLTDYEIAVVYRSLDGDHKGDLWVRRRSEFHDGRFEPIAAAPQPPAPIAPASSAGSDPGLRNPTDCRAGSNFTAPTAPAAPAYGDMREIERLVHEFEDAATAAAHELASFEDQEDRERCRSTLLNAIRSRLASASSAREEALEEAANLCDDKAQAYLDIGDENRDTAEWIKMAACEHLAKDIRALKADPTPGAPEQTGGADGAVEEVERQIAEQVNGVRAPDAGLKAQVRNPKEALSAFAVLAATPEPHGSRGDASAGVPDIMADVAAFLGADPEQPMPFSVASTLPPKRALLWRELIREEQRELSDAIAQEDIVEIAHEAADLVYVTAGMMVESGIPFAAVWREVHAANMRKVDPATGRVRHREDGKILKPEGWRKADVASVLDAPAQAPRQDGEQADGGEA